MLFRKPNIVYLIFFLVYAGKMHEKRENRTKGAISEVGMHIEKSGNQP
jgi:hypothetical protein